MLITPLLKTKNRDTSGKGALEAINRKILKISKITVNNLRFGFDKKVDYNSLEVLVTLRDILFAKLNCANWLEDYSQQDVEYLIHQRLKNIC